eukprot:m.307265 g.307265  ORF g.307265 m.307265 type:complete len:437 (+) comp42090_c0_seq1:98-1408(+)
MDHVRAQRVGHEFVRHYYTLLNKEPLQLHRFYLDQSSFVHASGNTNDEPVIGQKQIHEKIRSLNFVNCHAVIKQVDSLPSLHDAIVVQVTGEISNNLKPMRPFVQTFLLSPESPKKYYVRNDIFRYQDEIWEPVETGQAGDVVIVSSGGAPAAEAYDSASQVLNGQEVEPMETGRETEPSDEGNTEDVRYQESQPVEPSGGGGGDPEGAAAPDEPLESSEKPFSWANVAASKAAAGGGQRRPTAPPPSRQTQPPPPGLPVSQLPVSQPVPAPQPQRERPPTRRNPTAQGGIDGKGASQQPAPAQQQQISQQVSQPRQNVRHPDSHQIFIGNLAVNVTEQNVRTTFSAWGNVVEVRLHPKHFGFVIFDSPEPVRELLKYVEGGSNISINKSRVNLEEKKSNIPKGRGKDGMPGGGYQNRPGDRRGGPGRIGNEGSRR